MYRAIADAGHHITVVMNDMHAIDITALNVFITQQRDAVLTNAGCISVGRFGSPPKL